MVGGIFLNNHSHASISCPHAHTSLQNPNKSNALDLQLSALNAQFLQEHEHVSQLMSIDIDNVLIYKGDTLSLWKKVDTTYNEVDKTIPTANQRYTRLKQISHISVLVKSKIDKLILNSSPPEVILRELNNLANQIHLLTDHLKDIHADDKESQSTILEHTNMLIKSVCLSEQPMRSSNLRDMQCTYVENIKKSILYNNKTAALVQLSGLHELMERWEVNHRIDPEKCRVIIVSPHGPKSGRIETQYFTRWLQDKLNLNDINDKLVYSIESLPSKIDALDCKKDLIEGFLLAAELNKKIGEDLLGSSEAMFVDILAPYAEHALSLIFHQSERNKY